MIAPPWGYAHDSTDRWPHCVVCYCFTLEGKPQHDPGCRTAALESTVEAMAKALEQSENALLDYVDKLEKQGGTMGYGHSVLREVGAALASWCSLTQEGK